MKDRMNWVALFVMVAVLAPASAWGEATVAVLDVARVFEEYEMTRDLEAVFDQRRRAAAEEADQRRSDIEQMRRALTAFDPASEDYARREADLTRAEVEFQVWTNLADKRLKNNHKDWMLQIYHNTKSMVSELAKERGIDLVLTYDKLAEDAPDSATLRQQILLQKVIYYDGRIDITDEVVERLNKRYRDAGGINSVSNPPNTLPPPTGTPKQNSGKDKPAGDIPGMDKPAPDRPATNRP